MNTYFYLCSYYIFNLRISSNGWGRSTAAIQYLHRFKPDMYERYNEPNGAIRSCWPSWRANEMQVDTHIYVTTIMIVNQTFRLFRSLIILELIEAYFISFRSNCEDQINSLFVTTSSYPNRKTLFYREEFCIVARR